MSCIRFSTEAQRAQLREAIETRPAMLTPEQAASRHPVPVVTESKIRRLRILASDANPKIRESVASNRHAPDDVSASLARDPDDGVRSCLARNETVSPDVLRSLAGDESATVRGWLAINALAPTDVLDRLATDSSETVRGLVAWRSASVTA